MSLPDKTTEPLVVALAIHPDERRDLGLLAAHGWTLVDPAHVTNTPDRYRAFVQGSKGEIGVAKSGYAASRCGWFSDRSVCYLASGRPVVAQETGFSRFLPTGEGLFAFETTDEALCGDRRRRSRLCAPFADRSRDRRGVFRRIERAAAAARARRGERMNPAMPGLPCIGSTRPARVARFRMSNCVPLWRPCSAECHRRRASSISTRAQCHMPRASAIEEANVRFDDGSILELVCKDTGEAAMLPEARRIKPRFLHNPLREIATYERILAPFDAWRAPLLRQRHRRATRALLALSRAGVRRATDAKSATSTCGGRRAAGWPGCTAGLRATPAWQAQPLPCPSCGTTARIREPGWGGRNGTWTLTRHSHGRAAFALPRWRRSTKASSMEIAALPSGFVHGEFFASNVLVETAAGRVRVRPVDWEVAGMGPMLMDLAALTAGRWTEDERAELAISYPQHGQRGNEDFAVARDLHAGTRLLPPAARRAAPWMGEPVDASGNPYTGLARRGASRRRQARALTGMVPGDRPWIVFGSSRARLHGAACPGPDRLEVRRRRDRRERRTSSWEQRSR